MSKSSVNQVSGKVSEIRAKSQAVRDIIKGGAHMRSLGERYLPKFELEGAEDYKARLQSTWLFNGTKKARDDMAGRIFEKPVVLEDQNGELFQLCRNIDLEGRDLSNFASDVFNAGLEAGISFILVDAPPREGEVTRQQARAQNLRPYMAHINIETVLGWRWESINNAPTLTHFRFMEMIDDPDNGPFDDKKIEQVRAYFLEEGRVVIRLYQAQGEKKEFVQIGDDVLTDMNVIQVVPFYAGRTGFMDAVTPLAEIAEVNLAHWRVQSDKSSCLHKALAPLLLLQGIDTDGDVLASAGYAFKSNADNASITWSEISGSGIERAEKELEALEKQMQWMGVQLMTQKVGTTTATESSIEEGKSVSRLRMWADNLKDALEIAMDYMAEMAGLQGANTSVVVHKDFAVFGGMSLTEVREMYNAGVISREAYIIEAKRRGVLAEEYNAEDDAERIEVQDFGDATAT